MASLGIYRLLYTAGSSFPLDITGNAITLCLLAVFGELEKSVGTRHQSIAVTNHFILVAKIPWNANATGRFTAHLALIAYLARVFCPIAILANRQATHEATTASLGITRTSVGLAVAIGDESILIIGRGQRAFGSTCVHATRSAVIRANRSARLAIALSHALIHAVACEAFCADFRIGRIPFVVDATHNTRFVC